MQTVDPYKPPASDLKDRPPGASGQFEYGGFWHRAGATLLDFLILSPLALADFLYGGESRLFSLYMMLPAQLISVFFYIFMVVKYGGTPGKLILGLRIAMADGSPVTVKAALLRYSVMWALSLAMSAGTIMAALSMQDSEYLNLSYMARAELLSTNAPAFVNWAMVVMQVWFLVSIVTMLANKKRRTLHDFIAGTVVLRK